MTPEERRELAERLIERADRIDLDIMERAIPIAPRAEEWSLTLRRAAAALREDADMGQRASDELLRACEAERERDEPRERLADVEVVAGFIASEVGHWSPGMAEQARELIGALEAAGWQIVAGDAVVIPRSAIPDGLVERLWLLDGFLSQARNWDGSALRRYLRLAARLLSGGATEGRTCWPEEGT